MLRKTPLNKVRLKPRRKSPPKPKPEMWTFPDGHEVCNLDSARGRRIYQERKYAMRLRQNKLCPYCGLYLANDETSFDHQNGRGAGKRDDRIWVPRKNGTMKPQNYALHMICNESKGSRRLPLKHFGCDIIKQFGL